MYIYLFIVTFHISLWNGWRCVYPIDIPSALVPQGAYANPIACLLAVDGRENFWEDASPRFDLATCRTCSPRREHVADLGKGGSLEKWRCKKKSAACQQRGFQQFMNLTDLGVCENGVFTTENGKCLGKTMNNHQINHRSMAQPNPWPRPFSA